MSEILVSAEIPFVNVNLSRISAETKISDLSKISAEIWLRLETFREFGPRTFVNKAKIGILEKRLNPFARTLKHQHTNPVNIRNVFK